MATVMFDTTISILASFQRYYYSGVFLSLHRLDIYYMAHNIIINNSWTLYMQSQTNQAYIDREHIAPF